MAPCKETTVSGGEVKASHLTIWKSFRHEQLPPYSAPVVFSMRIFNLYVGPKPRSYSRPADFDINRLNAFGKHVEQPNLPGEYEILEPACALLHQPLVVV